MITYRNLGRVGRLGNAIWELASTIGIGLDHGEEVVFPEDWIHRPFFSVPDELFGPVPEGAVESSTYATHIDPRSRSYLQDINLFWPYVDLIRDYLKPSKLALEVLSEYELPPKPILGIHVRRGDKVPGADTGVPNNNDYHLCMPLRYYELGISQLLLSFSDWHHAAVFSDDIPWCKTHHDVFLADFYGDGEPHFKEHEPEFFTTYPRDWIDLFLLAQCDYFVLSGSTFGVWAAILANVPPDHVIRPDKIYGPLLSHINESLLYPPGWRNLAT